MIDKKPSLQRGVFFGRYTHYSWQKKAIQMHIFRVVVAVVLCLSGWWMIGCSRRGNGPDSYTTNVLTITSSVQEVQTQTGISFPTATVLLFDFDGSEKDASYGFYTWLVHSPVQGSIDLSKVVLPHHYVEVPLSDSVGYIESRLHGRTITGTAAFDATWTLGKYEFRATLVNAQDGDYLSIERFAVR